MSETPLLRWLNSPAVGRGIRFAGHGEAWDFWSFERLATLVRSVAESLRAEGIGEGDVVSLVQRGGPAFVGALLGAMLAGATPSPLAPPMAFQDRASYVALLASRLAISRPSLVVTDSDASDEVSQLVRSSLDRASVLPRPCVITVDDLLSPRRHHTARARSSAGRLALLQFTSGTTGRSRAVRVTYDALEANVSAIRQWLRMEATEITASWLPVHHDMGLIGCLLTPIVAEADLLLFSPEQFIQRPERYLRCFGELGASLTAMPCFGLEYIARRVRPETLAGLDFSNWRAIIVGAERIYPSILKRFYETCAPFGLSGTALLPAYGLAEACLAVTGLPLSMEWNCAPGPSGGLVVGCGYPLAGLAVEIVGNDGRQLADGEAGEVVVRGSSVAAGYISDPGAISATKVIDGMIRTGDAGFMVDGQLFVLGRMGDGLKVRGRTVFAADLEDMLVTAGIPAQRIAILLGVSNNTDTIVVLCEDPTTSWTTESASILRRQVPGARLIVLNVRRGTIVRTSSGKPMRNAMWLDFVAGCLDGSHAVTD